MFPAYNPPLISPVPSISRTCSLNPPKDPSLIAQTFAKGLPTMCQAQRTLRETAPYSDGPQRRLDVELQPGVNVYTGKDQGNVRL